MIDRDGRPTTAGDIVRTVMTVLFNVAGFTLLLKGHTPEAIACALLSISWRKP